MYCPTDGQYFSVYNRLFPWLDSHVDVFSLTVIISVCSDGPEKTTVTGSNVASVAEGALPTMRYRTQFSENQGYPGTQTFAIL